LSSLARSLTQRAVEIYGRPTLLALALLWAGFFLLPALALGPVSLSFWQVLRAGIDNPYTLNRFDLRYSFVAVLGLACVLAPLGMLSRRFRAAQELKALPLLFLVGLGVKMAWHLLHAPPSARESEGAIGRVVPLVGGAREAEALSVVFAAPEAGRSAVIALLTESLSIGLWLVLGASLALFGLALVANEVRGERLVRRRALALTSRYERGALIALLALWAGAFLLPVFHFEALANFTFWELLHLDFEGPLLNVTARGLGPLAGLGLLCFLAPASAPFAGPHGKWLNVLPLVFLCLFGLELALVLGRSSVELEAGPLGNAVSGLVRRTVWSTGKERIALGFLPLLLSALFFAYLAFRGPRQNPPQEVLKATGLAASEGPPPLDANKPRV